jgi:hypothetical protein
VRQAHSPLHGCLARPEAECVGDDLQLPSIYQFSNPRSTGMKHVFTYSVYQSPRRFPARLLRCRCLPPSMQDGGVCFFLGLKVHNVNLWVLQAIVAMEVLA